MIIFSVKKFGYGKTFLLEILVFIAILVGDHVRVEFLNDLREKEVARQEEEAIKKEEAEKEAERLAEERRSQKKRELVKDFALKESPSSWEVFLSLENECGVAEKNVAKLEKMLKSFNKKPSEDGDFIAARSKMLELKAARDALWKSMERAYIQYCKFKASSGDPELAELSGTATAEAVKEAESARNRYRALTSGK